MPRDSAAMESMARGTDTVNTGRTAMPAWWACFKAAKWCFAGGWARERRRRFARVAFNL